MSRPHGIRRLQRAAVAAESAATLSTPAAAGTRGISRDARAANDGRAAADGGTTGGSTADDGAGAGGTPTLHGKTDSAERADRAVARGEGAGRLR